MNLADNLERVQQRIRAACEPEHAGAFAQKDQGQAEHEQRRPSPVKIIIQERHDRCEEEDRRDRLKGDRERTESHSRDGGRQPLAQRRTQQARPICSS